MRVVLAITDPDRREAARLLLESECCDCAAQCVSSGREALQAVAGFTPHVLVLDRVLPLLDGPAVLLALRSLPLPCPPKVVFVKSMGREEESLLIPTEADICLEHSYSSSQFLCAVREAENKLQGSLAFMQSSCRGPACQSLLKDLGMPESLKGHGYLLHLMDLLVPYPGLIDALTTKLYPAAADRFHTTSGAVERCVRHAIEATWNRGSMAALESLFGLSIDPERGKPTNREFLAMAAQHVRNRLEGTGDK